MTMSRISAPAMAAGFLLSLRHVRERSASGSSGTTMTRPGARVPMDTAASAHPDLRVEVDVEHVDGEVDEHHDEREKEDPRCTMGKSSWRMAPTMSRPTPGTANTVSVITAPPSSSPNWRPATVTRGRAALTRAWWQITSHSDTPLARAVRT